MSVSRPCYAVGPLWLRLRAAMGSTLTMSDARGDRERSGECTHPPIWVGDRVHEFIMKVRS